VAIHATGHYPMIEKPDDFNAALEKVIAKIGDGKNR
jgi:pimeloyl-ACP methyl ester carboxylesterase